MKNIATCAAFFFTIVLFSVGPTNATIINGNFETNDLSGWEISVEYALTVDGVRTINPAPYEDLLFFVPPSTMGSDYGGLVNPSSGNYMANVDATQGIPVEGYANDIDEITVTLSQSVQMKEGEQLTGEMAFGTGDWLEDADKSFVSVNGDQVMMIDVTDAYDTNMNTDQFGSALTPWNYWAWTAPGDGLYTLSLNVYGDDAIRSWAYFDDIKHVEVPEPTAGLLLIPSLLCLAGVFRFKKSAMQ